MRSLPFRLLLVAPLGLLTAALHGACSPDSGVSGSTATTGDQEPDAGILDPPPDTGLDPDAACALVTEEAVSVPLNLYILLDKSSSMAGDKWASAKVGLTAFLNDARFAGTRVALRFFPRDADAVPACDQNAYKEPTVAYGPLPDSAAAIVQALEAEAPDGFNTPIYPALGGALLKGIEVAQNNPDQASAVLLVTDGQPQGPPGTCSGVNPEDPAVIANLASTGAEYNPPVFTYVIGLPGAAQTFANQVAAAGGTGQAVLVSATNVAAEFQDALTKVTGEALPCEYEIPSEVESGDVAITSVNVLLTLGGGEPALLPQDATCDGAGWRYDVPGNPSHITLCPATCATLKEQDSAKIQILLGCSTIIE
ncbi:vWA domain-containing protein [Chondromyces apiculatus]|nr:vWA domain-containing protein [Chondromyces apiculatus]